MNEEADRCLLGGRPNNSTHLLLFVFFHFVTRSHCQNQTSPLLLSSPIIAPTFSIAPSKPQIRSGGDPKQTRLEGEGEEEEEEEEEEKDQTVRRRNQPSSAGAGAGAGAGGFPLVLSPDPNSSVAFFAEIAFDQKFGVGGK